MKIHSFVCLALLGACAAAMPATAAERLSFRALEYDQPRDPLVGSNVVFSDVHHSSADQMAPALAALTQAVPAGTPRLDGVALLQKAGARCAVETLDAQTCTYHDVETVDENMDDILWTILLATAGDTITGLTVDRTWQRH